MALIIDLLFIGFWVVFAFFVVTQILLPNFRGTKPFPIFRKKIRAANRVMMEAREANYEASLEEEARRLAAERRQKTATGDATDIIDVTPLNNRH